MSGSLDGAIHCRILGRVPRRPAPQTHLDPLREGAPPGHGVVLQDVLVLGVHEVVLGAVPLFVHGPVTEGGAAVGGGRVVELLLLGGAVRLRHHVPVLGREMVVSGRAMSLTSVIISRI